MNVSIEIERSTTIPLPYSRVRKLLEDVPETIRVFPKLRRLTEASAGVYVWELEPIGAKIANISHEVSFASKFTTDPVKGLVKWKPVKGHGNALIEGRMELKGRGPETQMKLAVWGELHDVPVPMMLRMVAPPFIQGRFTSLVEGYFVRLNRMLGLPDRAHMLAAS
jgi:hypothetical protein